jgi:hypothetical protein
MATVRCSVEVDRRCTSSASRPIAVVRGQRLSCTRRIAVRRQGNSPFYGVKGEGWFLSFPTFTNYVKVTFFQGASLRPVPPGGQAEAARWIDVHEDDFDEARMATWIRQAAALPGWGTS